MKYVRVCCKNTAFILMLDSITINCPNQFGGVGYMGGVLVEPVWTGDTHLYFPHNIILEIQFCNITSLETTDDIGSDDSPWEKFWEREKDYHFTYDYWNKLAEKIRSLKIDCPNNIGGIGNLSGASASSFWNTVAEQIKLLIAKENESV